MNLKKPMSGFRPNNNFLWFWWGLSLLLHFYAAWFSIGWHFPDEQMSVIEFMSYWIGRTPPEHLPWEFHWQIRPWLQPLFYGVFAKAFLWMGWDSPLGWATVFRGMTGLLAWSGMIFFCDSAFRYMKSMEQSKWMVRLFAVLWFFPYLHVRTSSDCSSGILLLWMFGFLWSERFSERVRLILAGICLGLSFDLRINIGMIAVALALMWPWLNPLPVSNRLKSWFLFFIPSAVVVGLGVVLDRIGYGNWVFTPFTYAHAHFTTSGNGYFHPKPWYTYFEQFATLYPLFSIPLIVLAFRYWWKNPKEPISFVTWTFALGHQLMSGRDYRFFFPVIMLLPFIAVKAASEWGLTQRWIEAPTKKFIIWFCVLNLVAVPVSAGRPASFLTAIYALVWKYYDPNQVPPQNWLLSTKLQAMGYNQTFYHPPGFDPPRALEPEKVNRILEENPDKEYYVLHDRYDMPFSERCALIDETMPRIVMWVQKKTGLFPRSQGKYLYFCKKAESI